MEPNSRREQDKTFAVIYTNLHVHHSEEVSNCFLFV